MYAILGLGKLKSSSEIAARLSHHMRAHEVPNAAPGISRNAYQSLLPGVGGISPPLDTVMAAISEITEPKIRRKDQVRAVELLLTASPEFFKSKTDISSFADKAREFLFETFSKSNIASWGIHVDETTPHIWAVVLPVHQGKLRANHWLDGPQKLADLHTRWGKKCEPIGLERGVEKSGAKHIDIRTYYAAVNGSAAAEAKIAREMRRRAAAAEKRAAAAEEREKEAQKRTAELEAKQQALVRGQQASERVLGQLMPSPSRRRRPGG